MQTRLGTVAVAAAGIIALTGTAATASSPGTGAPATTAVAAGAVADATCTPDPDAPLHEMRGLWVASVANIDWPSRPGLSPEQAKAELDDYYDLATARGLNSVVVQVRPTADTFWDSDLEPWSRWIASAQGVDPGWDPMAYAVEAAHERGLDFHAWFNPYRVTLTGTDVTALHPEHPARLNPDWVVAYGGRLYYDPGVPAAREHTEAVVMEAVERYDLDGVHFDDYFYPYPVAGQEFDDADTYATYGDGMALDDWRRANVDTLIRNLDTRIQQTKPWVSFGVSPFAVWRNASTDPENGSATTAGAETYDDLYADTRGWVQQGWVDYIAPQVYWNIGFAPADYAALVPWWSDVVAGTDVDLYIGQATYKVALAGQPAAWFDPYEMVRHLDLNEAYEVDGNIWYSANQVEANRLGHMDLVQAEHYSRPALPPVTDGGSAVDRPTGVSTHRVAGGTEVRWDQGQAEGRAAADGYAVYRLPETESQTGPGRLDPCDLADATHLVAVLGPQARSWVDPDGGPDVTYVVTALSSDNSQSAPSVPVRGR
jgi:uncharacterized lipoprotein YddW (UPF0748 family)